ncbi:MAG: hypothetical protein ACRET6_10480 [Burkholderiales bacterium]
MKLATALTILSFTALLGACAGARSLVPGQSTEADVRTRMGAPTDTRTDSNGDKLWEYATGPEGFHTHLVRMGTDGRVKEVTELLTEENLARVVPGKTTRAEVRNMLGKPADETTYRNGLAWSWRFRRMGVAPSYMVVSFNPDGTARETIVIVDPSGDSRDN